MSCYDYCNGCEVKGDLELCASSNCMMHLAWYAIALKARCIELEGQLKAVRMLINNQIAELEG